MNRLKNLLRHWLGIEDAVKTPEVIHKFRIELNRPQEPVLTYEESRRLTISQAEEFKEFINNQHYPTFQRFFNLALENRISAWLSQAGEVDSYAKQLRAEINLLMLIKNSPLDFIQAGKNAEEAEKDTGAVT